MAKPQKHSSSNEKTSIRPDGQSSSAQTRSASNFSPKQLRTRARAGDREFLDDLFNDICTPFSAHDPMPTLAASSETVKEGLASIFVADPRAVQRATLEDGSILTKVTIQLTRHAQAVHNLKNTLTPLSVDTKITSTGEGQAKTLGERYRTAMDADEMDVPDINLCSTLRRCRKTLDLFSEAAQLSGIPTVWVPLYRERLSGNRSKWSGRLYPDASTIDPSRKFKGAFWNGAETCGKADAWRECTCETKLHLQHRAWEGLGLAVKTAVEFTKLTGKTNPTINIITHGDYGRTFLENLSSIAEGSARGMNRDYHHPSTSLHNAQMKRVVIWLRTDANGRTSLAQQDDGFRIRFLDGIDPTKPDTSSSSAQAKHRRKKRSKS